LTPKQNVNDCLRILTVTDIDVSEGKLVWYNERKGYGFVTAKDVFVHSRVLNDCGVHSLMQGQKLLIKVDDAGKGLQVQAARLLNE
jgi:cold shock CspA family protein